LRCGEITVQKVSGVRHGLSYIQGGNLYLLHANCKGAP
jgi:hypothetical protein